MNFKELLKSSRPPKKDEITDRVLAKLFLKYKGLLKESEREKAFSAATHENIRIAYAKLDELVEARTAELIKTNEQLQQEVTERKQAEEALQKAHDELEERVEERTAELDERIQEAEQLNRAMVNLTEDLQEVNRDLEQTGRELETANKELDAFSYSVSHDLRAPLRAIDGFGGALVEDYWNKLDDEGQRLLDVIQKNTKHMGQLIEGLLDLSRLGRQRMNSSKIDMTALAKGVCEEVRPGAPEQLQIKIKKLPPAQGDRSLVHQVYVNLISNAIKFSRAEEVPIIEIDAKYDDGGVVYSVKDNGVGFDMQYADKLFAVFQRLHRTKDFEGTGIGLSLVQRIINRHGGRIWAEGEVNKGATFYFTLPMNEGSPQ